jgi:hypothetical protein
MSTKDPIEDQKNYRKGIWFNQARINYELVHVNRKLIQALETLIKLLQADHTVQGLKQMDLTGFQDLLTEAGKIATEIASIDPPGCQGPPPYRIEVN